MPKILRFQHKFTAESTIEYKDADGNTRTKDVVFITGADAKATAANLAKAINDDAELSKVFKATSDKDGQLSVESKLDITKLEDGDSITIDGKTYTFDANKDSVANSFKSIADLQKLLGSDYEVNVELNVEKTTNNNILAQAGQAMLAQANQSNQGVLSLLG